MNGFLSSVRQGGRAWVLSVPVQLNSDPDVLLSEIMNRFKALSPLEQSEHNPDLPSINESYDKIGIDYSMESSQVLEQSEKKEEITEEKLLEFNLEQEFDRFYFKGHGNEYSIRISKTGGRLYGCGNNAIPVSHVHEFQNLYKLLTGEELTPITK